MRHKFDFYETPPQLTQYLVDHYLRKWIQEGDLLLEPCSGDLAIANVLTEAGYRVVTNDIDREREADMYEDARSMSLAGVDWVVTNPPYSCAEEIVYNTLKQAKYGGAYLLRLTFLEPVKKRRKLLKEFGHCLTIIPVNPRPRFIKNKGGTDSVTVAWFLFDKDQPHSSLDFGCLDWRTNEK